MSDIDKRKKPRKGKKTPDYATPNHAQAAGYQEEMSVSDTNKRIAPVQQDKPSGNSVAVGHPDLIEHNVQDAMTTVHQLRLNTQAFVGQAAFASNFGSTDRPPQAPGDNVEFQTYSPRDECGEYRGVREPVAFDLGRPEPHQHRDSATPDNGTHSYGSQEGASSYAVPNKSIRDIMRDNAVDAIKKARG